MNPARNPEPSPHGAAFGGTLAPGSAPAVLVVDMVNAYLDPDSPLYAAAEDTLAPAARVLAAARGNGHPVIYTRVQYLPGGVDGGTFFAKVPALAAFVGETSAGAIAEELRPNPTDVVLTKQYASAFFGTSLASTLRALQRDTLVVMGYSTSGCVRATAVDACQHGYVPLVVREGTADRARASHEVALADIAAKYGEVWDVDAVEAYLAETPPADVAR